MTVLVNALLAQLNGRECKTQGVPGTYSLSQLGARSIVPVVRILEYISNELLHADATVERASARDDKNGN